MKGLKESMIGLAAFGAGFYTATLFIKHVAKQVPVEKEVLYSQEKVEIRVSVNPEKIAENQASGVAKIAMKLAPKFTTIKVMSEVQRQLENGLLNEGVETYSRIENNTVIIEVLNSKDLIAVEVKNGISKALEEKGIGFIIE